MATRFNSGPGNALAGGLYDPLSDRYRSEAELRQMWATQQQMQAQAVKPAAPDPSTNPVLLLTGEDE